MPHLNSGSLLISPITLNSLHPITLSYSNWSKLITILTKFTVSALLLFLLTITLTSKAEININIVGAQTQTIPIAVLPFTYATQSKRLQFPLAKIVASDLRKTGYFEIKELNQNINSNSNSNKVNYRFFKLIGVENIVTAHIRQLNNRNNYVIQITLHDVLRRKVSLVREWIFSKTNQRLSAHRISDLVFEHITGKHSAFTSRIAYIMVTRPFNDKQVFRIRTADTDGYNARTLIKSQMPLLSPAWSPNGKQLAYVSFENGRSEIFIQNVLNGERKKISFFKGLNTSPAWSPSGTELAMTLSKDGNAEVYTLNLLNGRLRRQTQHPGIDTEPAYSSDPNLLFFTSNRSGSPEVYQLDRENRTMQRLTKGRYNAGPSVSQNGDFMVLLHKATKKDKLQLGLHDLKEQQTVPITNTFLDDSPSIAPFGNMLIYTAVNRKRGKSYLVMLEFLGLTKHILQSSKGEIKDPAWGPPR